MVVAVDAGKKHSVRLSKQFRHLRFITFLRPSCYDCCFLEIQSEIGQLGLGFRNLVKIMQKQR